MQSDQNPETLKAELRKILPEIEEMRKKKIDRKNEVFQVLFEVQSIKNEICSSDGFRSNEPASDEADLSTKRLEELHKELQALQKEKVYILCLLHCTSIILYLCILSLNRDHESLYVEYPSEDDTGPPELFELSMHSARFGFQKSCQKNSSEFRRS